MMDLWGIIRYQTLEVGDKFFDREDEFKNARIRFVQLLQKCVDCSRRRNNKECDQEHL